jgi:IS5 family transposase
MFISLIFSLMLGGKDKVATEFGAKISDRKVDCRSRAEHISWNNFNESVDLKL